MTKRFELGLAKDYISDWTVSNAIREFMQNAIDQANGRPDNAYSVEYNEDLQELRIANKASVLEKSTLLLGTTTKGVDDIGGFGEGYKLACLVMLRNGIKVSFENYGAREIWNFKFSKLKKYDYVESLVCDVETQAFFKKVPNNNLTVILTGITPEQHQQYLDLLIDPSCEAIETEEGRVLKTPGYKGKVYVNGLYVANLPNFEFGYDLKPAYIKVGRDRNLVNEWDLSKITKNMWLEIGDSALIRNMLERNCADVSYLANEYGWDYTENMRAQRTAIADEIYSSIRDDYGDDVLLASSEDEKEKLENSTRRKVVFMPDSIKGIVKNASGVYKDTIKKAQEDAESEDRTVKEQIYAWAQKRSISSSYLHELFDIIGDFVDAKVEDITEELRNERIFEYQQSRLKSAIYTKLTEDTENIFEAMGLTDNYENEKEMFVRAYDFVDEIYKGIIDNSDYTDEKTAVCDHIGDLLEDVEYACDEYVQEMLDAKDDNKAECMS